MENVLEAAEALEQGTKHLQREVGVRSVSSLTQVPRKTAEGQPEVGLPTTDSNLKTLGLGPCAQVQQSLGRNGHS